MLNTKEKKHKNTKDIGLLCKAKGWNMLHYIWRCGTLSLSVLIFHTFCEIYPSMEALGNWYVGRVDSFAYSAGNESPLELAVVGNGKS